MTRFVIFLPREPGYEPRMHLVPLRAARAPMKLVNAGRAGRKAFFFEKKKQKTFVFQRLTLLNELVLKEQKFFGAFFQKRTFSFLLVFAPCSAHAADDAATRICRTNPAFTSTVMQSVLQAQLEKDHDPALDAESPEQIAAEATEQGVNDCAAELRANPGILTVMTGLTGYELQVGWDAFNISCADHKASKAECIRAEIGSVRALKRMIATNQPSGAKALVEACELVLQSDPAMAEWRSCVDQTLAMHASSDKAASCKLSVSWHTAKTGAEAAAAIGKCLKGS